jgi:lambda repressor-like predicted transcriptional regulator
VSLLNFDPHQFAGPANRQRPVSAEFDGHDFQSNGISHQDYGSMQVETHKLNSGRRGAAPDWVFNDSKLRAVIVGCIEARAYGAGAKYYKPTGTDAERLARAQQVLSAWRPNLEARVDKLCRAFLDAKWSGRAADEKELAQKVEEVDTQLRLIDAPAKYYAGVCYYYWRSGLNSVETGQQLGMKPPHVRGMLWRMGKIAGQLGYGAPKNNPARDRYARAKAESPSGRATAERFAKYIRNGMTWAQARAKCGDKDPTSNYNYPWRALCAKHGIQLAKHHGSSRVRVLSAKQIEEATALHKQGFTYRQLAKQFGVRHHTLAHACVRAGYVTERGFKNRASRGKIDIQEAKRLQAEGWSMRRIGRHFGVAGNAVHYRLQAAASLPTYSPCATAGI